MFDDISGTSSVSPTVSLDDSHILIAIQEISSFSNTTLIGAPHQKFQLENDTWFWSEHWQAQEREADQDLRLGNYEDFDTMDDFIASL